MLPWLQICSCYGRDFILSLSDDRKADVIDAFTTASGYLDDILNISNVYFDNMVSQIYPSGLWLGRANASDTEATFLDLHLSVSGDVVSAKICDERGGFILEIVNFPFSDGGVPRSAAFGVFVSQLVRFAGASGCVAGFGARCGLLARRLLGQGCRCLGVRRAFSGFNGRCCGLVSRFQVGLGCLLCQGLS